MNKRFGLTPVKLADKIQILRVGKWNFDDYGEVDITSEDIAQFVSNFKNNVRRQKLPINIEHDHNLGAIGWVTDVTANEDNTAVYMTPEWTESGKTLVVDNKAFGYTSAEIYRQWRDPELNQDHTNVLSGVAVTNFPRMKGMEMIAASEATPLRAILLSESHTITALDLLSSITKQQRTDIMNKPNIPPISTNEINLAELNSRLKLAEDRYLAAEKVATDTVTKMSELQTQMTEQATLLASEQSKRVALECAESIDVAKRQGRISPVQATTYLAELPKMNQSTRDMWLADIAARPAIVGLVELGHATGSESTIDPQDRTQLAEVAKQLAIKEHISLKEATIKAAKQMKAGNQ